VLLCCTAKSHPTAVTILPVQCISVVQPSLIPLLSLYCLFSSALLHSQVSSHSSHYTVSSVQLCCNVKTHPTAFTILPVYFSSVIQQSLIPQQSLYCQFSAAFVQPILVPQQSQYCQFISALLYSQVLSHSSHYSASSVQICCTDKSHPTAVTILTDQDRSFVQPSLIPQQSLYSVLCSYVVQPSLIPQQSLYCQFRAALLYNQVSSLSSQYTASSVQLCCTAKSYPTAVTILPVQCSSVVQPSLIPQQSLYCQFRQLSFTNKTHPTAVTIVAIPCSYVVQPSLIPQQSLNCQFSAALLYRHDSSLSSNYTASSVQL